MGTGMQADQVPGATTDYVFITFSWHLLDSALALNRADMKGDGFEFPGVRAGRLEMARCITIKVEVEIGFERGYINFEGYVSNTSCSLTG